MMIDKQPYRIFMKFKPEEIFKGPKSFMWNEAWRDLCSCNLQDAVKIISSYDDVIKIGKQDSNAMRCFTKEKRWIILASLKVGEHKSVEISQTTLSGLGSIDRENDVIE